MKVIQKQSTSSATVQPKSGQPFFQKQGEEAAVMPEREAFFSSGQRTGSDSESNSPFFQKTSSPFVQTKLTVGQPGDPYEQEADAMADKVVQRLAQPDADAQRPLTANKISPLAQLKSNPTPTNNSSTSTQSHMSPSVIQPKCADCEKEEKEQMEEREALPAVQRKPIFESNDDGALQMKCAACEQEEKSLQPKSASDAGSGAPDMGQIESSLSSSKGGGSALPDDTRAQMEGAFGANFSGVRVHTGGAAVQMNQDLQAQAFTHGSDVYFNAGKYDTGSTEGKRLLGHELTHVVQQGKAIGLQKQTMVQLSCGPAAIGSPSGCTPISGNLNGERFLYTVNCDIPAVGQEYRLRAFATTISNNETIDIHGFSSIDGDPTFNESLSCARAQNAAHIIQNELNLLGVSATINLFMHGATEGVRSSQRSVVIDRNVPATEEKVTKKCGPDVTAWLITQMTTNGSGGIVEEMRSLNNSWNPADWASALLIWAWLVRTGGRWDFKTVLDGDISAPFPECRQNCNGRLWSITLKGVCMTYEAVANIHYGYVGRMAGFSESRLLSGASGAQAGEGRGETTDAPNDVEAIQVGFSLFNQSNPNAFTAAELPGNHYNNLPEGDGDSEECEPCDSVYSG